MEPISVLETNPTKRIVVQHSVGPLKGLYEIMGIWQPLPDHNVPEFAPGVLLNGGRRAEGMSLIRQTARAYWYRELMERNGTRVPTYESMHPDQR